MNLLGFSNLQAHLTIDNSPLVTTSRKFEYDQGIVFYMDIISHLSDDLLLRFLSFNTTKGVVATSLLSKRWRFLWTLVPQLKYDDSNHNGDYKLFTQYVYRSLLSNKAPVLEHLHLNLGPECPLVDIGLWINLAVSRNLRELHIDIRSSKKGSFTLPSILYTSETLQRLTLINCVYLDVPVHVRLPSLRSLGLKFFTYANSTSLQRLLSGCPNLNVLCMSHCFEDPPMDVNIVVPSLQRLYMSHSNIKTRGKYVIDAPSLKYLNIIDAASCNFRQIQNMPELVRARVAVRGDCTRQFLKALTSARRLKLWMSIPQLVNPSGMIFNQLVHLDLYTYTDGWWDLLACMLQDSPKLRFLILTNKSPGTDIPGIDIPTGWKRPSSVPECLLHSLEAFQWFSYKGSQENKEMTAYVLNNANCLKTATFSPLSTDLGEKYQTLKELSSIATASSSCQLLFD